MISSRTNIDEKGQTERVERMWQARITITSATCGRWTVESTLLGWVGGLGQCWGKGNRGIIVHPRLHYEEQVEGQVTQTHFRLLTGECFTDFLFVHALLLQNEGLFCRFTESIHRVTWQSRANASLNHYIHPSTFTQSREYEQPRCKSVSLSDACGTRATAYKLFPSNTASIVCWMMYGRSK